MVKVDVVSHQFDPVVKYPLSFLGQGTSDLFEKAFMNSASEKGVNVIKIIEKENYF